MTLHEEFSYYGKNAKLWMRKCQMLLPEIQRKQIWRKKGFNSLYEYAAKIAGMSRAKVDDSLWIMHKIKDKPALKVVAEQKGLNAVRPVVSIATSDNEYELALKAQQMSQHTLKAYAKEIRNLRVDPKKCKIEIKQSTLIELQKLQGDQDLDTLLLELIALKKSQLPQKPKAVKTKSRHIPAKIKKYIHARANNRCEFPSCTKKYHQLHHTDRFALKQEHDPSKIYALCKAHHDLTHQGLIANEDLPPRYWKIRHQANKFDLKYIVDQQVTKHGAVP